MATYTTRLRLEKQVTGENSNTWGTRLNTNVFSLVDTAIAGYTSVSLAGSTVTLSVENGSADSARSAMLELHGTLTSNVGVVIPSVSKQYLVRNATAGSFTVTIKAAGGTGTAVTQGTTGIVYCDGASVRAATGGVAVRNIGTSVTEIPDISIADARYTRISAANSFTGDNTFNSIVSVVGAATFAGDTTFSSLISVVGAATFNASVTFNSAVQVSGAAKGTIITLTDGASVIVSMAKANTFVVTLGGNRTLGFPSPIPPGQSGMIYIYQDGTGSRTLAYTSCWRFAGGSTPTLTTTSASCDMLAYSVRTSAAIDAALVADLKVGS
tara:strand:+ start:112 stop:1089 length:978 start_codon:yes stop_codon:yes gene_type:complete